MKQEEASDQGLVCLSEDVGRKIQMAPLSLPGYKNLKVWQMAYELAGLIYQATRIFPNGHYRLIDQMIGAATAIFGNIAEGYCRNSLPAYINSCDIARGELGELIG
jgi:hypothetical protein